MRFGHAAHNGQHEQTENVVDDSSRQNHLTGALIEQSFDSENLGRDAHARSDCCSADKDRLNAILAECNRKRGPCRKRQKNARDGHKHRCLANLEQLAAFYFEPDAEEQEHDTEFGERAQNGIGLHPIENARAEQDASQNFADQTRLPDPLEKLGRDFGCSEYQQQHQWQMRRFGMHEMHFSLYGSEYSELLQLRTNAG